MSNYTGAGSSGSNRGQSSTLLFKCLLILVLSGLVSSIRFYEICEVGKCDNGGTMIFPQTFFGMCRCICPHPYTGALCRNKLKHGPTDKTLLQLLRQRRR